MNLDNNNSRAVNMDGSAVEGISTSLESCPFDPQELFALGDLPSPPSIPDLHVNDLGLTPLPGSQSDAAAFSRGKGSSSPRVHSDNAKRPTSQLQIFPTGPEAMSTGGRDMPTPTSTTSKSGTSLFPVNFDDLGDDVQAAFDSFDSEAALQDLEAIMNPQKRTGNEAFGDFGHLGPPAKRQHAQGLQQDSASPLETPSLSSPESFLRTEQGETAPHTPFGTEQKESPSSLFDNWDPLFDDPNFDIGEIGEFPLDFDLMRDSAQTTVPNDTSHAEISEVLKPAEDISREQAASATENTRVERLPTPSTSETTLRHFSLDPQDLISSRTRELLQRICPQQVYTSPYPKHGGPLGYLPSAPGIHVKCIEVADEQTANQITHLTNQVNDISRERDKYKKTWSQWTTIDPETGRSRAEALRVEHSVLRRLASQRQIKMNRYQKEADEWQKRFYELSSVYNNLLYDINVRRTIPAVAPTPDEYRPPKVPPILHGQYVTPPQPQAAASQPPSGVSAQPPSGCVAPQPSQPCTGNPGQAIPRTQTPAQTIPVTIDLTDDPEDSAHATASSPNVSLAQSRQRTEKLQSLRNKEYSWLKNTEQTQVPYRATSVPPSGQRHTASSPGRSQSYPLPGSSQNSNNSDDDFARMMEEELAQS